MILKETKLKCSDNSGANIVKCVSIFGHIGTGCVGLGSLIKVAIKNFRKKKRALRNSKNKKKELYKRVLYFCLVVNVKRKVRRRDGTFLQSDKNKGILLSSNMVLLGSKISGYVTKELGVQGVNICYQKVLLLAKFAL